MLRVRRRVAAVLVSIRTRLALFFFLITLLAIAVVYLQVAPSLQSSLEKVQMNALQLAAADQTSSLLDRQLARLTSRSAKTSSHANRLMDNLRTSSGAAAVTLVQFTTAANGAIKPSAPLASPTNVAANAPENTSILENYSLDALRRTPHAHAKSGAKPVAQRTVLLNDEVSATVNPSLGLVAVPYAPGGRQPVVFVFSTDFRGVTADVVAIRQRILTAAAIALAVVLALGVLVARALTVRVLRLERAAQRVAGGDFSATFEVDSTDELGQLAAALAHMQSQLRELEHARRRFIAIASHELRTPIFSLGGFLELIQDEDLDEDTRRQFVGQIREQVARLGKLATGLLDLSRLEAGSIDLEPTPTDLGVLSRAVASEFAPALSRRGSALELHLPQEPLRAVCDPDRVAQLVRILIDNAITHTPAGTSVVVSVEPAASATTTTTAGDVRIIVADDGPGIAPDAIERIFEPFYSADGVQGAGLGLAIARELSDRLRASLEVRSSAGETVFTLTVPAG